MTGAVQGAPRALLRLEGAALLAGATLAHGQLGGGWGLFASAFLLPDLALLAYLGGPRWGARAYNLTHTAALPLALLVVGWVTDSSLCTHLALIWLAHIGLDHALGFGLKYPTGFADTHLGQLPMRRDMGLQATQSRHGQYPADR